MDDKIYSEPSDVKATDGNVKVDGPDAVDVGLTPDAADETGDRLIRTAREARVQASKQDNDNWSARPPGV